MKQLVNSSRILLIAIVAAGFFLILIVANRAQAQSADPDFEPLLDLQRYAANYPNEEMIPQNDSNTAAADYRIGIKVPPGRNGLEPNLALVYSSSHKNGWMGVGWRLDLEFIQRSIKRGVNYSANDYVFNGSAELVPRTDWGAGYYGLKIESAFSKFYFNPATSGWEMTARDGTRFFYGSSAGARQDNSRGIFKWCLDRVVDTNGNTMNVAYAKDQGQIYLEKISYTDDKHYVLFILDSQDRPDAYPMYDTGSEVVTAKRLDRIETYGNGQLARVYQLEYELGNTSGRSRLLRLRENSLPPTVFFYQDGSLGHYDPDSVITSTTSASDNTRVHFADVNGDGRADLIRNDFYGNFGVYLASPDREGAFGPRIQTPTETMPGESAAFHFADIDGDGLSDLIKYNISGYFRVYPAAGDGTFDAPVESDTAVMANEDQDVHFADVNGDGRADLIKHNLSGCFNVHLAAGDGSATLGPEIQTCTAASSYDSSYKYVIDVNGDGLADLIKHDLYGMFRVYLSNGDGTFDGPFETQTTSSAQEYDDVNFVDLNGDGMADLVRQNLSGIFKTYLSTGDGAFAPEKTSDCGAGSRRIHFADVSGDGLPDLIRHDVWGNYAFYISTGDGGFEYGSGISTGVMTNETGYSHFEDINGDGLGDLIKYNVHGTFNTYLALLASPPMFTDTSGNEFYGIGTAAEQLVAMAVLADQDPANGYVAIACFSYRPSSHYQNTLLPFIVPTLASVRLAVSTLIETQDADGVGFGFPLTLTEYAYSGGYYDPAEREFRGFQKTIQTNPDGTSVTRRFHQDDWLKGKEEQVELKDPQGTALVKTTFSWDRVFLDPPHNTAAFVGLTQKHTDFYNNPTVYRRVDYTYDITHGGVLSVSASGTDAESITTAYQYQNYGTWLWRRILETKTGSQSGKMRQTIYDHEAGTGNLLVAERWLDGGQNPTTTMTYDGYGNPVTVTDARGNTTETEYDTATHAYPAKITFPPTNGIDHIVEHTDYDYRWGKIKVSRDENGQFTYYSYDDLGRLLNVDYPDGGRQSKEYIDDNSPRLVITRVKEDSDYSQTAYRYYDGIHRKIITVSLGEVVDSSFRYIELDYLYDEMGRNYLNVGPFHQDDTAAVPWQRTVFDFLGRPVRIERPVSEYGTTASTLNYQGFDITTTDPDLSRRTEEKDYLGRIIAVVEHADGGDLTTNYAYNAAGDLLAVTDHFGHQTRMQYDTLGRKIEIDEPNMGIWTYTYDANGNPKTQTDYKSQTIAFDYDELNRVTSKTYSTADPAVTYVYDNLSIPNGRGRLYSISNTLVTGTVHGYDQLGRETRVGKSIAGSDTEYVTEYHYNLAGKLTQIIYPDLYEVNYFYYPSSGLLRKVTGYDPLDNTRYYEHYFAEFSDYTPSGQTGRIDYGGYYLLIAGNVIYGNPVVADHYTYDPLSTRLEQITSRRTGSDEYLQWIEYKYTPAGDIREKTDNVRENIYTYSYDKLHRLIEEQAVGYFPPMQDTTLDYAYDDDYQPHAVKQITLNGSADYSCTYDANGNMEAGPDFAAPDQVATRSIAYNADNMPVGIVRDGTAATQFVYDGKGLRAKKIAAGGSVTYYIDNHYEIKDGHGIKYIFAGNRRIAKRVDDGTLSGAVYYYHKDHQGSSTLITDSSGEELESSDYLPFGHLREHRGQTVGDYKFTDQELDTSTGLYNYDARLYDPVIGRFISADSIVPDWYKPQALDRYAYTLNNPLTFVDPNGNEPVKSQVTDLKTFMSVLKGIEGNLSFKESLNKLGEYPFGGVPSNNPLSKYRYIYTKSRGWIDITHMLGVAYKINKKLEGMVSSEFWQSIIKRSPGAHFYAKSELWDKTVEVEEDQTKRGIIQSVWSYEDAPSNLAGLDWYFTTSFSEKLSTQLESFLKAIGATEPQKAPNWESMPQVEVIGKPPTATNKSFDPMYTSDDDDDDS